MNMKKIIFEKLYDTETAKLIGTYNSNNLPHDEMDILEELYQKQNGEFFIYGKGSNSTMLPADYQYCPNGHYFEPLDDKSAQEWVMFYLDADVYIELFGIPEE